MWNIISAAARVFNRTNLPDNLLGMLCLGDDNSPVAYGPWWSPSAHKTQPAGPPPPPPPRRRLLRPAIIIIILYTHILFTQVRVRVDTERERQTDRPTCAAHATTLLYLGLCDHSTIYYFIVINCTRPTRYIFWKSKKRYAYYVYHRYIYTQRRAKSPSRIPVQSLYITHK